MKFREHVERIESKVELNEGGDFYRLPKKVINDELYVLMGLFENLYKRNASGNDFKPNLLAEAEKLIKTVKKSIVKNPSKEEMEKLDK